MKWEKVKLGDIATFSNGINFNKTAYAKGIKLIGVSNFGDRFYPDYSQLQEVKKDIVRLEDCLRNGDIVFVRSNGNKELVGRCMLVKNPTERVTYSGFCIRARLNDTDRYDPVYFTYYFKSKAFRRAVSGTAVGANIQNLSQARLSNHECRIPSIEVQHRIADILSAYDDLIENNQKQIKLLEEVAQRLYKEWFVNLRFPGHENTKIVDGVPEEWRKFPLEEIAPVVTGKKDANYGDKGGNYPFFTCSQETITAPGYSFDTSAVILAGNGDFNVKLYRGKFEAYQRTYVLAPFDHSNLFNLYFTVQNNMEALAKGASGSTIKFLTKGMLQKILVLTADKKILDKFNDYEENIQQKVEALKKQVEDLTEIRNRLLPKLMSGEVEV
ncbi:restriction endonuclease subunit S [Faecalibacterium sp.]|uniref:restriction endonuclease subunit S n=1 Tax=Faecalibacterium sp. TaxID=1971605 RepID=UPI003A940156